MIKIGSLMYPSPKWLTVQTDLVRGVVMARVIYVSSETLQLDDVYEDRFEMSQDDIGPDGEALLKEAYFRRAQLMIAAKAAKVLK